VPYWQNILLKKTNKMNITFTKTHGHLCGAAIFGMLTYLAFPYPICVAVGAILGAMIFDADMDLPV
jgi:uncharacterized membrane protein